MSEFMRGWTAGVTGVLLAVATTHFHWLGL